MREGTSGEPIFDREDNEFLIEMGREAAGASKTGALLLHFEWSRDLGFERLERLLRSSLILRDDIEEFH